MKKKLKKKATNQTTNKYQEFVKSYKQQNAKASFKEINEAWKNEKSTLDKRTMDNNNPDITTSGNTNVLLGNAAVPESNEIPKETANIQQEKVEIEQQTDAPFLSPNSQKALNPPQKKEEKDDLFDDDDDEMLPSVQQPASFSSMAVRDRHKMIAHALHKTGSNIITLATDGGVKIDKDDLNDLDDAGAEVLAKYDKDGKIAMYSPEVAYVLTLGGIVTQVMMYRKAMKDKKKAETDGK